MEDPASGGQPARGTGRRAGRWWKAGAFVVLPAAIGAGLLVAAWVTVPEPPPQPAPAAAPPSRVPVPSPGVTSGAPPLSLPRSEPVRIDIPGIDVRAPVTPTGVDEDGEIEVPPVYSSHLTGWYRHGAAPGELGPAVITGHVDSDRVGPAVFFRLGSLQPGALIRVVRKDNQVAEFRVDGVASFEKDEFPAERVYGPLPYAGLRLVTCGGAYDKARKTYLSNVIVFATLANVRPVTPADTATPVRTWFRPLPSSPAPKTSAKPTRKKF
ncbi:class F sortase [Longispora albida]|uniref:class F sortase n=1 Tax=Longispora albida TaxID=203523 RepID=UPI0003743FD2|nr:class F sortase [Longispora albida]